MSPNRFDPLPLAADRLQWALNAPAPPDDPDGLARLARALAGVAAALSLHADEPDAVPEVFGLVDPNVLPFTPLDWKVRKLRRDHATFAGEAGELQCLVARPAP